jgi:ankyrin repeat protein
MAKLLIEYGADVNYENADGTLRKFAEKNGRTESANLIKEAGGKKIIKRPHD